jgi:DNA-binding phage protein
MDESVTFMLRSRGDRRKLMGQREKTAFDLDFEKNMGDPEFRTAYERARARIDAIDQLVRTLDAERAAQKIPKAELARRMGVPPEAVRRLFSTDRPNPTMKTVVAAAEALGLKVQAVPAEKAQQKRRRRKRPEAA